jgi:hypothetical protein
MVGVLDRPRHFDVKTCKMQGEALCPKLDVFGCGAIFLQYLHLRPIIHMTMASFVARRTNDTKREHVESKRTAD